MCPPLKLEVVPHSSLYELDGMFEGPDAHLCFLPHQGVPRPAYRMCR